MFRCPVVALCLVFASTAVASAATVAVTGISGTWSDGALDNGRDPRGLGSSAMSWGTPANTLTAKSGYSFAPTTTPFAPELGQTVSFGEFTHDNFAIYGAALAWADLNLNVDIDVNGDAAGGQFSLSASYRFLHDETPNIGPRDCCNDLVSFSLLGGSLETFVLDGITYTFSLLGFVDADGNPVDSFSTVEGRTNRARLMGRIWAEGGGDLGTSSPPAPVPLPAPAMLLGGGIAALTAAARRRKS